MKEISFSHVDGLFQVVSFQFFFPTLPTERLSLGLTEEPDKNSDEEGKEEETRIG